MRVVLAYIDPGTGSYVLQLIIGGLLGVAVTVKAFWRRIWSFLTRHSAPSASGGDGSASATEAPPPAERGVPAGDGETRTGA